MKSNATLWKGIHKLGAVFPKLMNLTLLGVRPTGDKHIPVAAR
jgi:hypothetical protein